MSGQTMILKGGPHPLDRAVDSGWAFLLSAIGGGHQPRPAGVGEPPVRG